MPIIETGLDKATGLERLEAAKQTKLKEINDKFEETMAILTNTYPQSEMLTFDKQEQEAREYLKSDKSIQPPLLASLAASRGIEFDELVRRVILKADAFTTASGFVIGQRQAFEDKLDIATTIDEINSIVVTYSLG